VKELIREFFIQKFNHLVETDDIVKTEARNKRYQMMLSHYMDIAKKNECKCFNSPEDLLKEIAKSEALIRDFILNGITVQPR
jgi:hypothetical protein